jgi:4-diphosphocytidyl-2-C-methyl-D-erythritol kinase
MILVYPEVSVSTAQAYKALTLPARLDVKVRLAQLDQLLLSLKRGRPVSEWGSLLFNRLEQAAVPELGRVEQARRILEQVGARGVRMSGSGSSVFGFVSSHAEGERCMKLLRGYPWKVFLTSCHG